MAHMHEAAQLMKHIVSPRQLAGLRGQVWCIIKAIGELHIWALGGAVLATM